MPERIPFDLLESPLDSRNLLEASAGTGKTFTIAALFLRLLLETDLQVDQILVVTYTEAATEELRDRIRKRIRQALEALEALEEGREEGGLSLPVPVERFRDGAERRRARRRLAEALVCFDEAAIHTIHGFCQRLLKDRAFEAGALFDTELVTSQAELLRELAEDFWRRELEAAEPEFAAFAAARSLTPAALAGSLGQALGDPDMEVLPSSSGDSAGGGNLEALRLARIRAAAAWEEGREEIRCLLLEHPGLNRSRYRKEHLGAWLRDLEAWFFGPPAAPPPEKLEKFTPAALEEGTKKDAVPPVHPFFDLCGELLPLLREVEAAFERRLIGLRADFVRFARRELPARKRSRNVRYFDDLLLEVRRRIESPAGPALLEAVREQFRAAFIDEFQDTDPVQFAIFRALYPDASRPVFYIGDPKQAIYSFRGADIFAYMAAAGAVDRRYTLGINWRSAPALVAALNELFGFRPRPFVFADILFAPVAPSPDDAAPVLCVEGEENPAPFRFWLVEPLDGEGSDAKGESLERLAVATAAEIGRLLRLAAAGEAVVGGRSLRPEDLAVLVRTHREGGLVEDALARQGISCVQYGTGSLFDSREAREVLLALRALAEPGDEALVRGALGTSLFGLDGEAIGRLAEDVLLMEEHLEAFGDFHQVWRERGPMAMTGLLLGRGRIRERLLARADGERSLTNVLHCFELLHRAAQEQQLGVDGLVKWFARQFEEGRDREENQIRLETDERAVKIVTIHKSKGLEYGVVFAPFCWNGSTLRDGTVVTCHDPASGRRIYDLGSDEAALHRRLAERERLAENMRLLYVALTRAKYRCYVAWGPFKGAETSALAYLLHGTGTEEEPETGVRPVALEMPRLRGDLGKLAAAAAGTVVLEELPEAAGTGAGGAAAGIRPSLVEPAFEGKILRQWRTTSFSSLVSGGHGHDEPAAGEPLVIRDETAEEPSGPADRFDSILDFPRGALAGSCLHAVFEKLDFSRPVDGETAALVREQLRRYGFEAGWTEVLLELVRRTLAAPLATPAGETFTLASLRPGERLAEMEFFLPVGLLRPEGLADAFRGLAGAADGFPERLAELGFVPHRGAARGFIDLVFRHRGRYYLLDWKSNHLGDRPEDYGPESLGRAMAANFYLLQYHLYLAALDRFLFARVPGYDYERHVGGVVYLFLRGMAFPDHPGAGIFRDRPSARQVRELVERLRGGEEDP